MAALQKSNKKRGATSQPGPAQKKVHLDKPEKNVKQQRRQPVTAPSKAPQKDSDEEDEDAWTDEDETADLEENEADEMAVDSTPTVIKDPNAARESHKAQKLIQEQRKASKPHSNILSDAKRVWSLARQKNLPTAERQKHIQDLMNVMRGKVKDIVLKHDASRIVQTVVKYGRQKERDEIAAELKGKYRDLAQNKYSKFLVTKLIRLSPTHRPAILSEFRSHVLRLLLHREASSVLADAFELYANAYERTLLVRDFYGKEAALFSGSEDKEKAKRGLRGVLEGTDTEPRRRILAATKESLTTVFNNPDKGAITHAIVHRALWEYLTVINEHPDEAEREKQRREMFECCQDALAEMVHTKDGSRVVREFLSYGSAKDRKIILKTLKPHIERMCLDDEAQLVLFTALDVIDDTKNLAKTLISEITSPAPKLYTSPQGRRALLYLLVPRCRRHFTPAQIATLAETDAVREQTSKKSAEVREDEVRRAASDALVEWIVKNADAVVREPGGSLVVAEVMLYASGDKSAATNSLLSLLATPYPSTDDASPHIIDLPHASRLYKTLLQGGHFNHATKTIDRAASWDGREFAAQFVDVVGEEVCVGMCTRGDGNGAFVVAELCEALCRESEGTDDVRAKVKGWFGPDVVKQVESSSAKGKKVLLEKIAAL